MAQVEQRQATVSGSSTAPPAAKVSVEPKHIAASFVQSLEHAFASGSASKVSDLFHQEGYFRDVLSLSWDFRTIQGKPAVKQWVESLQLSPKAIAKISLEDGSALTLEPFPNVTWVQAFFKFETKMGNGRGCVRLQQVEGDWKAYLLYTGLEELKGYEEKVGARRPQGVEHVPTSGRESWKQQREKQLDFTDSQPEVVIVGAGQGGLTLAARLKQVGVNALIVEQNARVGDNWRKRYDFLVLHDPVWYDHLPYMPFPAHWPIFTPKDKLADWFEAYVQAMELSVWTGATLGKTSYDDATKQWTVEVTRSDGTKRTLTPGHVVLASGHSGEANIPHFKGEEEFAGKLCHSSQHTSGREFAGKKAVVVGCCNSGHDIAQDFYEQGVDTTIIQRSSTYVMSSDAVVQILLSDLYSEGGPPTEDADLMFNSIPNLVHIQMQKGVTKKIAEFDKDLLDGLRKAGFKLDFGPEDSGFLMKYFTRGGGYYLDVSCSKLIASGDIAIKQGSEISHFTKRGVVFEDGQELEADIVVLATGYKNMRTSAERIFGKEVSERTQDVWGINDEGEIKTMWRDSGHPGFYYMGANLALCRFYSKRLALLILARLRGLA